MLILGGVLAIYVGVDAMNDKIREERQKQDEKLEQAREEIERVKAQSQQYMEEIVKLKQQTKNASPQNE
jgi:predicted  nucleic acid-binding Zn-ribbon protein